MKIATPQSLPDGESSSAGISVSTAATMKAASGGGQRDERLGVRLRAEPPRPAASAAGCGCASRSEIPAAIAVPARPAPSRNFRRGSASSVMETSRVALRWHARCVCGFRQIPDAAFKARLPQARRGRKRIAAQHRRRPGLRCRRGCSAYFALAMERGLSRGLRSFLRQPP